MPAKKAETSAPAKQGDKTARVIASLKAHPEWTRVQHAEKAGCTVGRVGEIVRAGGVNYTAAQHAANVGSKKDLDAQLAKAEERVRSLKAAVRERDAAARKSAPKVAKVGAELVAEGPLAVMEKEEVPA